MSALENNLSAHVIRALLVREFRAAFINRYFQIFCALALLGGIAATIFGEDAAAIAIFDFQLAFYFVSLFALLAGVGSAQAERDEWQLLFSQPLPRPAYVVGKFCSLLLIFAGVLLILLLPGLLAEPGTLALLYLQSLLLAAAFTACGLAVGYFAHDRAQALIIGVSVWLLLLFGVDLIALFSARWSAIQQVPNVWLALLMLNPLDAFRIDALFALQQIPAEAASKTSLATWWIGHTRLWFGLVATFWCAALVLLAGWRLKRWEE